MNENLVAAQEAVNLTADEIVQLTRNAFAISWLEREDKDKYLDAVESYAAEPL